MTDTTIPIKSNSTKKNGFGKIKTYVLRQSRMSKAQIRAYEDLLPSFSISYNPEDEIVPSLFSKPNPIIMEIGFGMGHATAEIAEKRNDRNFLGVEVHKPGVGALLARIKEHCIDNLKVIQHDAVEVLREMVPDEGLAGVHLFFPDPWPKKRHHKRRIFQKPFADLIFTKLTYDGYLYAVTDWEDYAYQMLEVAKTHPGFQNPFNDFACDISWRPQTAFERKGILQKHQIFELFLIKTTIDPSEKAER
jgi:tRNA (guanine-N7-)-methyltransferase